MQFLITRLPRVEPSGDKAKQRTPAGPSVGHTRKTGGPGSAHGGGGAAGEQGGEGESSDGAEEGDEEGQE